MSYLTNCCPMCSECSIIVLGLLFDTQDDAWGGSKGVKMLRYDWTYAEVLQVYMQPLPELVFQAQSVHRQNFPGNLIQRSTLLSAKTGGCTEDCSYCAQSARYKTGAEKHQLVSLELVMEKAREAKASGSTRLCLGAAWREVKTNSDFEQILEMVKAIGNLGLESCCTLGMLTLEQAKRLREAGCSYYNHNLDSSPDFYREIVSTHTYEDRLNTLRHVRAAGMKLCCGGIIGLGESRADRLGLLLQLSAQNPHPESVPVNMLVPIEGTPLAGKERLDPIEFVRTVATARIIMPRSFVRLSAGRLDMSEEMQALCFIVGANSIFSGDKLLTTPNCGQDQDEQLMEKLGMSFMTAEKLTELDKRQIDN